MECIVEVAVGLLLTHCQIQHGLGRGDREAWGGVTPPPPPWEAQTYRVSFPKHKLQIRRLVEECLGGASNQIVILEEGNQSYPRCPKCDMFV